jgi:hypothetical protein
VRVTIVTLDADAVLEAHAGEGVRSSERSRME